MREISILSVIAINVLIAYFPVVKRLWQSKKNTKYFGPWIGILLAPIIALYSSRGTLATVYSVRAIVLTSILLLLMLRAELGDSGNRIIEGEYDEND